MASILVVCGTGSALLAFAIQQGSGAASLLGNSTLGLRNPTWIDFSPDGAYAYVVDEIFDSSGSVSPFSFDGSAFSPVGPAQPSDSPGTVHAKLHPGLEWLATASYAGNSSAIFPRSTATGALESPTLVWSPGQFAHAVTWAAPDTLFIPCLGSNYIAQYRFNPGTGAVTPAQVRPALS